MEIDMYPPSSFSAKSTTNISVCSHPMKRPRSPASPSDRPFKRVSLAVMNDAIIPLPPPLLCAAGSSSMFQPHSAMMVSADDNWVAQTRGLKIEGPVITQPIHSQPPLPVGIRGQEREEDMGMDCDSLSKPQIYSLSRISNQDRPHTTQIQTAHPPSTQQPSTSPPEHCSTLPYVPSSDHIIHTALFLNVNLRPAISSETPGRNGPIDSVMPTSSPSSQRLSTPVSPSVRRQRFTMGPRGDCEKCRTGLKGHWVHVD